MNTIKTLRFGVALGLAIAIINLICILLMLIAGDDSVASLANNFAHGIDLTALPVGKEITAGTVVVGLLVTFAMGFVIGVVTGGFYNALAKKQSTPV